MRVAIVHHWFVTRGGGERVVECIAELFPDAEIFTLLSDPAGIPPGLRERTIHESFLSKIPLANRVHRHLLPLFPAATRSLNLRGFDLVLSSDSGPVKGVRIDTGAIHICYCHSPMRYLYDQYESYSLRMTRFARSIFAVVAGGVRKWDRKAAARVTYFIANSQYVAARIQKFYGRTSVVINPPIYLNRALSSVVPGRHYLCVGRLVGYKRTELLLEACLRLGRPLRIVGSGPEEAALKKLPATSRSGCIEIIGEVTEAELWQEYASCRALLFAADEDFGMVPLEAQASGRPVIAYGQGGSLETIRGTGPYPTGIFFTEQTVESVVDAILRFEAEDRMGAYDPLAIREWAAGFEAPLFKRRFLEFVMSKCTELKEPASECGPLR